MGMESIVYGRIEGASYRGNNYRRLQDLNRAVIESLPEEDDWPFLTRHLFALPGPWPHGGLYRCQVIHFGGSFKGLEDDWRRWRDKFEALLRRLYWFSVRLHLETEARGRYEFAWLPDQAALDAMFTTDTPSPVSSWTFTGECPFL